MAIQLPGIEDRTLVIGRTGSGKTIAGLFLLSRMPVDQMPWVIINYKKDKNINAIPYAHFIEVGQVPTEPGVYIVQPLPSQDDEMSAYLMAIWDAENIGVFVDEGVMLARNDALDNILIQGRSKQIPVIILSQRPVGISRFAFTESQYMMIFPNQDRRERKVIGEFTPLEDKTDLDDYLLPRYHFYYYDVNDNKITPSKPVPNLDAILNVFASKLKPADELNADQPAAPIPQGIKFVEL